MGFVISAEVPRLLFSAQFSSQKKIRLTKKNMFSASSARLLKNRLVHKENRLDHTEKSLLYGKQDSS